MAEVLVPVERLPRWVENFRARHGDAALAVDDGALVGQAADGSTFSARLPFDRVYDGPPALAPFQEQAEPPDDWGILLVRKGGFAVARLQGADCKDSKVGQRHVQGRTKAGGQSQQRFARRRDNQARQAYEAAAGHAARILEGLRGPLVTGGDRTAVGEVVQEARLQDVVGPFLTVPDPRRSVLEEAILDACACQVTVVNA